MKTKFIQLWERSGPVEYVKRIKNKMTSGWDFKMVHCIPTEDFLSQRINTKSLHEDKVYSTMGNGILLL
jgi:hypothetical protein